MRNGARGTTLVEAAIVIPILLMFLIGIIEFARAYNIYQVVSDAAREGCRFAIAPYSDGTTATLPTATGAGLTAVESQAQLFAQSAGISNATVTITDWPSGCTTNAALGTRVNGNPTCFTKVTVTAPFTFLASPLLFGDSGVGTVTISSSSTMRRETNIF